MALEYSLVIATHSSEAEIADCLVAGEYRHTLNGIAAPGVHVHIGTPGRLEVETISHEFNFVPNISMTFRLDKEADPVTVQSRVVRGCMLLLAREANNAVLLFNGEFVVLQRIRGDLLLNASGGFWRSEILAAATLPHRFESLPNI